MLVERDGELATAHERLHAAREGTGGLLLIEGTAGIGKSALLESLVADPGDTAVLRARGTDLERSLGFGVARQLFERPLNRDRELAERVLQGAAVAARGVLTPAAEAPAAQESLYHALTWLAANFAEERPLLIAVDDLQLSDPASLGWLEHLTHRIEDLPALIAATWRIGEGNDEDALDRLRDEPVTTVMRPAPLSAVGVETVVRATLSHADAALCEACARSTGGNPFLLRELLHTLTEQVGVVEVDDVRPESVGRSVGRRLARLGAQAIAAAESCAILGQDAELRHVAALAGLAQEEAAVAVDALVGAGILMPGRPLAFAHPLVASAVRERAGEQARATAHGRAARILDAERADVERVALHLLATAAADDPWAVTRLLAAVEAALARGAAQEARTLVLRALDEPAGARRADALLGLCIAEDRLAHKDFGAHLSDLLEESTATDEQRAEAMLQQSAFGLPPDHYTALAEPLITRLGTHDAAQCLRAVVLSMRLFRTPPLGVSEARSAIGEVSDATPGGRAMLATLSYHLGISGQVSAQEAADVAARALGRDDATPASTAGVQALVVLCAADRLEVVARAAAHGLEQARRLGAERGFGWFSLVACTTELLTGRLPEAEADARAGLTATRSFLPTVGWNLYALARVLLDRGNLDEAATLVEGVRPEAPGPPMFGRVNSLLALSNVRAAQGRWAEAAAAALRIGELNPHSAGAHLLGMPWRSEAAVALAMTGDHDRARALIAEQWPLTRVWDTPRQTAYVLRAEAIVEGDERGIPLLEQAVTLLEESPARLELARTLGMLGAALRRRKQRNRAVDVLRRAVDLADRSGADALVAATIEELRLAGARPRRVRTSGVESLTAGELRVARMAAAGMGNKDIAQALFVTRRTVETHLSSVYRKLDLAGREQLGAALKAERSLGLIDSDQGYGRHETGAG